MAKSQVEVSQLPKLPSPKANKRNSKFVTICVTDPPPQLHGRQPRSHLKESGRFFRFNGLFIISNSCINSSVLGDEFFSPWCFYPAHLQWRCGFHQKLNWEFSVQWVFCSSTISSHAALGHSYRFMQYVQCPNHSVQSVWRQRWLCDCKDAPKTPGDPDHEPHSQRLRVHSSLEKQTQAVSNAPKPQMCFAFRPQTMLPRAQGRYWGF